MIAIKNLNKYYNKGKSNEVHVINDTTINLNDTGLVCILGESGSGKTTLMNTISGLDDFDSGTIDVDGTIVSEFGDKNQEYVRNAKFAYIFQNYYLLMDRTVEYNIMLALSMYEISDEEKMERIEYVLKSVDMWRFRKRLVSQLSGGQQQRIAIARALSKSPKVIFADEPTGNLDEANTMKTMGILKKISKKCLVIVVTHEKAIADFFADRILWIRDGVIEKQEEKESHAVYQYIEDNNLYIQEYEKKEIKNGNATLEIYNGNDERISVDIVYGNGKIYINTGDSTNVEFLTTKDEKKVIDSKRPIVEMSDVNDIDFELNAIDNVKKPKMTVPQILEIAVKNIRAINKKQIFLGITLFVIAVLLVISVQDMVSVLNVDKKSIVTVDSHYYTVSAKANGYMTEDDLMDKFSEVTQNLGEAGYEIYVIPSTDLTYQYEGIVQLENAEFPITAYSFVDRDKLNEKELIYGEMPKENNDVVIDKWVLDNFVNSSAEIKNITTDITQVIGKRIETTQGIVLNITGISDTKEPAIYAKNETMITLCRASYSFMTDSDAKNIYEDYQSGDLEIEDDQTLHVFVDESTLKREYQDYMSKEYGRLATLHKKIEDINSYKGHGYKPDKYLGFDSAEEEIQSYENELAALEEQYGMTYEEYNEKVNVSEEYKNYSYTGFLTGGIKYIVTGCFPSEYGVDFIISEDSLQYFEKMIIDTYRKCQVYVEDSRNSKHTIDDMLSCIPESILSSLNVKITNTAEDEIASYQKENSEKLNGRILITVTIFLISLTILYFIMKANAITRIGDLGVYRMLGISKGSILAMFAIEITIITSMTSLVGAGLTVLIMKFVAGIEALEITFVFPWYIFVMVIVFLYGVNVLIGILPVQKMLKLPPAQLAAKYDI